MRFPAVQKFENRLTFDKVTESVKVNFFETQCRTSWWTLYVYPVLC